MMLGDVSFSALMQALTAQLALFLAWLLGASALHKVLRWRQSLPVMREFAGVPAPLAAWALAMAIGAEAAAAALLVFPGWRLIGALLAASLWTGYLLLIVEAVVHGRGDIDCGCSFGPIAGPLSVFHIARSATLWILAMLVACGAPGGGAEFSQLIGGFAFLALYAALDQVMALRPLRRGEVL